MSLVPAGRARERVLVYGMAGVGKSLGALDIARNVSGTVWVVDNDNAWDRMLEDAEWAGAMVREEWGFSKSARGRWELESDDRYTDPRGNIVLIHASGWEQNTAAIAYVVEEADRDDWLVIDSATSLWGDVQDWYSEQVFNEGIADYFLRVRIQNQKAAAEKDTRAFEGFTDWPVVNAQYKKHVGEHMVNPPCHLYITCEQDALMREQGNMREDRETKGLFGEVGFKPKGQKRTGHNVQTVVWLSRAGEKYRATTVKDRGGREYLDAEEIADEGFAEWYLARVGGWKEAGAQKPATKEIKKMVAKG